MIKKQISNPNSTVDLLPSESSLGTAILEIKYSSWLLHLTYTLHLQTTLLIPTLMLSPLPPETS